MKCNKFKGACFLFGFTTLLVCIPLIFLGVQVNTPIQNVSKAVIVESESVAGEEIQHTPCVNLPPSANEQALVNAMLRSRRPGHGRAFDNEKALNGWIDILSAIVPDLLQYESPIQARIASAIDSFTWNCIATFSPNYKDSVSRHTPAFFKYTDDADEDATKLRFECFATGIPVLASYLLTPPNSAMTSQLETTLTLLGYAPMLNYDATDEAQVKADLETQQIENLRNLYPIGALVAYEYIIRALRDDGWNQDGRASCTENCIPYSDPGLNGTGFPAYLPNMTSSTAWQPLRENDSRGFVFYGEHVTPHIGLTGRFKIASSIVQAQTTPAPNYTYKDVEIPLLLERMRLLNDESKMLIELFDDKLRLAFVILGNLLATYPELTWEDAIHFFVGFTAVEHDAILLTWREKRRHDLARPPTLIRRLGPTRMLDTFPTVLKATEFEPYIRTMPHSEFPSGSASICNAIQNYTDGWIAVRGLQGEHSDAAFAISVSFPPGSSLVEPGTTPSQSLTVEFASMTQLAAACRQSRLDAGLHFTAAVAQLGTHCQGLGAEGVDYVQELL